MCYGLRISFKHCLSWGPLALFWKEKTGYQIIISSGSLCILQSLFASKCTERRPLAIARVGRDLDAKGPQWNLDTSQQAYRMCTLLSPCKRLLKWSPLMHGGQWRYLFPPRRHESPGSLLRALWHWFSKHHMVPFLVQTPRSSFTSVKERNHVFFFFFCSVWHD